MKKSIFFALVFVFMLIRVNIVSPESNSMVFNVDNFKGYDLGSKVTAYYHFLEEPRKNGEVFIEIESFNNSKSDMQYGIVDVLINKAILIVAFQDDACDINYKEISKEFFVNGNWKKFVNKTKKDSSTFTKISLFAIKFVPILSQAKNIFEGITLLDDLMTENFKPKKVDPIFSDENKYDFVSIAWSDPIVPETNNKTPFALVANRESVDKSLINYRVTEKYRVIIPFSITSDKFNDKMLKAYTVYSEKVYFANNYGDRGTYHGPYFRECSLAIKNITQQNNLNIRKLKIATPEEFAKEIISTISNNRDGSYLILKDFNEFYDIWNRSALKDKKINNRKEKSDDFVKINDNIIKSFGKVHVDAVSDGFDWSKINSYAVINDINNINEINFNQLSILMKNEENIYLLGVFGIFLNGEWKLFKQNLSWVGREKVENKKYEKIKWIKF